jgi:anion-transporting  ArsA/GET3 family ATPase
MSSLLDRQLVYVTGKGGVGKSTVAGALGLAASQRGHRTIVCEVGEQDRLARFFGKDAAPGEETKLTDNLWSTSIDPHEALGEWVTKQLGSRTLAKPLVGSNTFQYFVAAAPGAKEVVAMAKVWELVQSERWQRRARGYDIAIVDGPASGHGVGMLQTPGTIAGVARVGPIASQANKIRDLLEDAERSSYVAVALPEEMPVTETIELQGKLRKAIDRDLEAIVVNAVRPKRFTKADLDRIGPLRTDDGALGRAAVQAATFSARRSAGEQSQLRRLRKAADAPVVTLPYLFERDLDLDDLELLAAELDKKL